MFTVVAHRRQGPIASSRGSLDLRSARWLPPGTAMIWSVPIDLDHLQTVHYERHDAGDRGIAVVTLDRPDTRNAQNKRMTYELNACFDDASRRTDVKVIVLQAD